MKLPVANCPMKNSIRHADKGSELSHRTEKVIIWTDVHVECDPIFVRISHLN